MIARNYDAIVIGARCAGASTAMLLARKGFKVLLVDRAAFPSDIPHGHYIHRLGPRYLARRGVLDRVAATNCPAVTTMTWDAGDFPLAGEELCVDGVALGYRPRRSVLDEVLVDAAVEAGVELRTSFSVDGFTTDGDRCHSGPVGPRAQWTSRGTVRRVRRPSQLLPQAVRTRLGPRWRCRRSQGSVSGARDLRRLPRRGASDHGARRLLHISTAVVRRPLRVRVPPQRGDDARLPREPGGGTIPSTARGGYRLRAALRGNQEATNQFFRARQGLVPKETFFNPENLERLMGAARPTA